MATVYEVDVRIGLQDALAGPLSGLADALRNLKQQETEAQQGMRKMREEGQQLHRAFQDMFVGHEMMKWGEKGLGIIGGMVRSAADLESAMLSVQAATGMTNEQLKVMSDYTLKLSGSHTFSPTDAAKMVSIIGSTTFKDPSQIQQILGGTGGMAGIADFADVFKTSGKMGVEEATRLGMQFADLIGGNDPKKILGALDEFQRGLQVSGGVSPTEFFNSFKQIAGTGQALGMQPRDLMQLAAITSMKGLGTRTTTAMANQFVRIAAAESGALGRTRGGAEKVAAMGRMGLLSGPQDIFSQLDKMRSFAATHGTAGKGGLESEIFQAFDARGGRAFLDLLSPQTAQTIDRLRRDWERIPGLMEDHERRMHSVGAELAVLSTNFEKLEKNMGATLEVFSRPALKTLGSVMDSLANMVAAHPNLTRAAIGVGASASAGLLGVGSFLSARGFLSILKGIMTRGGIPVFVVNGGGAGGAAPLGSGTGGPGGLGGKLGSAGLGALTGGLLGFGLSASDSTGGQILSGAEGAIAAGLGGVLGGPVGVLLVNTAMGAIVAGARALGSYVGDPNTSTAKTDAGIAAVHAQNVAHAERMKALESATKHLSEAAHALGHKTARNLHHAASGSVGATSVPSRYSNPTVGPGAGGLN